MAGTLWHGTDGMLHCSLLLGAQLIFPTCNICLQTLHQHEARWPEWMALTAGVAGLWSGLPAQVGEAN